MVRGQDKLLSRRLISKPAADIRCQFQCRRGVTVALTVPNLRILGTLPSPGKRAFRQRERSGDRYSTAPT